MIIEKLWTLWIYDMFSNNIVNFQESTTILNAFTNKVWKLIEGISYI